jgi:EipB-like
MRYLAISLLFLPAFFVAPKSMAAPIADIEKSLAPHKAVYDIDLVATHSGSQIINISGKLTYEWRPSCEAYITDHHFKLFYEYADGPGMRIVSDFSTFESKDGKNFDFSSRRKRDGELYQDIRGHARMDGKAGKAVFTSPAGQSYDLGEGMLFPMGHTIELIQKALEGDKIYLARVFDGSDEEGPIEINSIIGGKMPLKAVPTGDSIDRSLLSGQAWNVRMAVFPEKAKEEESDYEMSMMFHRNGIISDMLIEYDDFSVTQKLVSLEKIPADSCGSEAGSDIKP